MIDEQTNLDNYNSHTWQTYRHDSEFIGVEYVVACSECGHENIGDPIEFPDVEYINCRDMGEID